MERLTTPRVGLTLNPISVIDKDKKEKIKQNKSRLSKRSLRKGSLKQTPDEDVERKTIKHPFHIAASLGKCNVFSKIIEFYINSDIIKNDEKKKTKNAEKLFMEKNDSGENVLHLILKGLTSKVIENENKIKCNAL